MAYSQAYLDWRKAEGRAEQAARQFSDAIEAGRHPSEAQLGELSRLRTAATEKLHLMIEDARTRAK